MTDSRIATAVHASVGLTPPQQSALIWSITDAALVLAWEWLYIPAYQHSFALYWTWYCVEIALAGAFAFFSYRWLTTTDGHRQKLNLFLWIVLLGFVSWRVAVLTEQVVQTLRPLAAR